VHVHGRVDDVVVSGGVNLAPAEIEAELRAHPGVRDAAVVGVPHARWGSRPVAVLVPRGAQPSLDDLDGWCRERLGAYKTPDAFVWRQTLPRDALGKLRRRELREELLREARLGAEPDRSTASTSAVVELGEQPETPSRGVLAMDRAVVATSEDVR